jgi:hypothetical protein
MLTPKNSVIPPGGWHVMENTPAGEKRIDGANLEDLARQLLVFRLSNRLPPGSPMQEVSNYICSRYPHFCNDSAPREIVGTNSPAGGLAGRVGAWLAEAVRLNNSAGEIFEQEAMRRAEICAKCPVNVSYQNGCGSCMTSIEQLSFVSRAGRNTPADALLMACAATGQHNQTAIWMKNLPAVSPAEGIGMPSSCWRLLK